jgi:phospholipid/cholesterol/gamma-HCH transport system substrate-binding protein
MLDRLTSIGEKADVVLRNLEKTTGTFADEEFRADVQSSARSLSSILRQVDEGDGYIGRLLRDKQESENLSQAIASLQQSSVELNRTLVSVRSVAQRVDKGPGFAHELIYGDDGPTTVRQFGRAADELATTLKGVREGNGLARSMIYGDDGQAGAMANLNEASRDVRDIVRDIKQGKGTLGALLVDPSVYEDLKLLLGNVERNKALRALVRYSIQSDERAPSVEIRDPGGASPRGASGSTGVSSGKTTPLGSAASP